MRIIQPKPWGTITTGAAWAHRLRICAPGAPKLLLRRRYKRSNCSVTYYMDVLNKFFFFFEIKLSPSHVALLLLLVFQGSLIPYRGLLSDILFIIFVLSLLYLMKIIRQQLTMSKRNHKTTSHRRTLLYRSSSSFVVHQDDLILTYAMTKLYIGWGGCGSGLLHM